VFDKERHSRGQLVPLTVVPPAVAEYLMVMGLDPVDLLVSTPVGTSNKGGPRSVVVYQVDQLSQSHGPFACRRGATHLLPCARGHLQLLCTILTADAVTLIILSRYLEPLLACGDDPCMCSSKYQ
jgi:hypothetical protein